MFGCISVGSANLRLWLSNICCKPAAACITGTIDDLVRLAGLHQVDSNVIRRMHERFSSRVTNALLQRDPKLALDTYTATLNLPSTTTVQLLNVSGYQLNGLLYENNDNIIIGYKGLHTMVVKVLDPDEKKRLEMFQAAISDELRHPHVVQFELINAGGHPLMVMPKLSTTLEPIRSLGDDEALLLVSNVGNALEYLHGLRFAHGDVKPSNIAVREVADVCDFVLIDLGSIVPLRQKVASTKAYVPRDLQRAAMFSSTALDIWMLGMTLSQKACGVHSVDCGAGATDYSTAQLIDHLNSHLPTPVMAHYALLLKRADVPDLDHFQLS